MAEFATNYKQLPFTAFRVIILFFRQEEATGKRNMST